MAKNRMYYLFGSEAVRMYHAGTLMNSDSEVEMDLFVYDDREHLPNDLLEAYDGWDGYAVITAEEYAILLDRL